MATIVTKPTLYIPQKDSPSTFLMADISNTDTSITVGNSLIFQTNPAIVRLSIGIDGEVTETVKIVSFGSSGQITIVRGTPAQAWPIGAKIARVLTAADISEVQAFLNALNEEIIDINEEVAVAATNAVGTSRLENGAVTALKLAANAVETAKIADSAVTNDKLADGTITHGKIANRARRITLASFGDGPITSGAGYNSFFISGIRVHPSTGIDPTKAAFNGFIPKDFVSDAILYVMVANFLQYGGETIASISALSTRFATDNALGSGTVDVNTTLTIPGSSSGDPYYRIRIAAIPLTGVQADDFISGGVMVASNGGLQVTDVTFEGAYIEYLADS